MLTEENVVYWLRKVTHESPQSEFYLSQIFHFFSHRMIHYFPTSSACFKISRGLKKKKKRSIYFFTRFSLVSYPIIHLFHFLEFSSACMIYFILLHRIHLFPYVDFFPHVTFPHDSCPITGLFIYLFCMHSLCDYIFHTFIVAYFRLCICVWFLSTDLNFSRDSPTHTHDSFKLFYCLFFFFFACTAFFTFRFYFQMIDSLDMLHVAHIICMCIYLNFTAYRGEMTWNVIFPWRLD